MVKEEVTFVALSILTFKIKSLDNINISFLLSFTNDHVNLFTTVCLLSFIHKQVVLLGKNISGIIEK